MGEYHFEGSRKVEFHDPKAGISLSLGINRESMDKLSAKERRIMGGLVAGFAGLVAGVVERRRELSMVGGTGKALALIAKSLYEANISLGDTIVAGKLRLN